MLNALYLAHNLSDPAVRRRVLMLQAGGAEVALAGFRRDDNPLARIDGVEPIELGFTRDGNFPQRMQAVAAAGLGLRRHLGGIVRPDLIIARNLEMLALAGRARRIFGNAPVVYECLDIHRLLLGGGLRGHLLRRAERFLARRACLLMTSSPAYLENYFEPLGHLELPVEIVENKVLLLDANAPQMLRSAVAGPPWTIGWFGALRCRRSLALLLDFARATNGLFHIVLRGRPAYSQFDDFDAIVAHAPGVRYLGPYRNPEDLAEIYGGIHFAWLVDFFEEGQNSDWLLPNRLYESCAHGVVPIAMAKTETARFLAARGIGLTLRDATLMEMLKLVAGTNAQDYRAAAARLASVDAKTWTYGTVDCRALVQRLAAIVERSQSSIFVET